MNKREQKMEKTKKADKPPVDPHREFLDMDTDEEDFGRQGSCLKIRLFSRILYTCDRWIK